MVNFNIMSKKKITKNGFFHSFMHSGRVWQTMLMIVWAVLCWAYFQTKYQYHFFYEEQEGLFLMDWEHVSGYFCETGWMAQLVGDFLSQFYYYIYAGAAIFTLVLLMTGLVAKLCIENVLKLLTSKLTAIYSWSATIISIIIITIEATHRFNCHYRLSSTIAVLGWVLLAWLGTILLQCLKQQSWKAVCAMAALCVTAAYWNFGIYGLTIDKAHEYPLAIRWTAPETIKEEVLAFDNEYYFGHYGKVIEMGMKKGDAMTEEMSFFYCMALEQKGMLADMLPSMKSPNLGTFINIGPESSRFTIRMIHDLYYLIGDMTYTERAALLANTFTVQNRSGRMIKRLAEANLINGDVPAATKYLRVLEKSLVYREWAKNHTPGQMPESIKNEIERKRSLCNSSDNIRLGDDCYTILTQLLESNKDNIVALDYLLCSDMLTHQKDVFVSDYEKYGPSKRSIFVSIYNSTKKDEE